MTRDAEAIQKYRMPLKNIKKIKARLKARIKSAMEFSPYRQTLEYKLELLNAVESSMRIIAGKVDKRFQNTDRPKRKMTTYIGDNGAIAFGNPMDLILAREEKHRRNKIKNDICNKKRKSKGKSNRHMHTKFG